jgi:hypothetical protein
VGRVGVDRGVDRFQVAGDAGELAAWHVFEAVANQVHDAGLHRRGGEHRLDRFRKPLQAIDAGDEDVLNATVAQL